MTADLSRGGVTDMTADEFIKATGNISENDDLERANCSEAGQVGHHGCGVCEHGKPVFTCFDCFKKADNEIRRMK